MVCVCVCLFVCLSESIYVCAIVYVVCVYVICGDYNSLTSDIFKSIGTG